MSPAASPRGTPNQRGQRGCRQAWHVTRPLLSKIVFWSLFYLLLLPLQLLHADLTSLRPGRQCCRSRASASLCASGLKQSISWLCAAAGLLILLGSASSSQRETLEDLAGSPSRAGPGGARSVRGDWATRREVNARASGARGQPARERLARLGLGSESASRGGAQVAAGWAGRGWKGTGEAELGCLRLPHDPPRPAPPSTCNFFNLLWCESNRHSVETEPQILNLHYFLD